MLSPLSNTKGAVPVNGFNAYRYIRPTLFGIRVIPTLLRDTVNTVIVLYVLFPLANLLAHSTTHGIAIRMESPTLTL